MRPLITGRRLAHVILCTLAAVCQGCGSGGAGTAAGLPSDKQIIADVTPRDDSQVLGVSVTKERRGEPYLHRNDLNWYFDRGVEVRRSAQIPGAPDAELIVGGLARYILVGDEYQYHQFLTTYNEYRGIPRPNAKSLMAFVKGNLAKVFAAREHLIVAVNSVDIEDEQPWVWHTPTSFTVPFVVEYGHVKSNTTVETRRDVIEIRFYRDTIHDPVKNLLATESERTSLGEQQYDVADVQAMKTLRDGLPIGN